VLCVCVVVVLFCYFIRCLCFHAVDALLCQKYVCVFFGTSCGWHFIGSELCCVSKSSFIAFVIGLNLNNDLEILEKCQQGIWGGVKLCNVYDVFSI